FRFKLIRKTKSYITPNEITVTGSRSPQTKEHVTPAPCHDSIVIENASDVDDLEAEGTYLI
ncbi:hypothetical protein Tco_1279499, partial [Tanacetum coccineum]